jgi:hypothetical protein
VEMAGGMEIYVWRACRMCIVKQLHMRPLLGTQPLRCNGNNKPLRCPSAASRRAAPRSLGVLDTRKAPRHPRATTTHQHTHQHTRHPKAATTHQHTPRLPPHTHHPYPSPDNNTQCCGTAHTRCHNKSTKSLLQHITPTHPPHPIQRLTTALRGVSATSTPNDTAAIAVSRSIAVSPHTQSSG